MDLIYANKNKEDLGVLKDYKFDLAYGSDENNFSITTMLENNPCEEDYIVYVDGTEYGGIIDSVAPNTNNGTISYLGRTWHGIMNSKVICPSVGYDYVEFNSIEAHTIIRALLNSYGLDSLFFVPTTESDVFVDSVSFRHEKIYDGVTRMLSENGGKLKLKWNGEYNRVDVTAELLADYSIDSELDASQVGVSMKKNYNLCNHLVCLGGGEMADRARIHLFTDEYGAIQQYWSATCPIVNGVPAPKKASHFILDERKKVLSGIDEITDIYDYSSVSQIENYELLTEEPNDWVANYSNYYKKSSDSDSGYTEIEKEKKDEYQLTYSTPDDWSDSYKKYYKREQNSDGSYKWDSDKNDYVYDSVDDAGTEVYTKLTKKPADWQGEYYLYYINKSKDDVGNYVYEQVNEYTEDHYSALSIKPKDWKTEYSKYYYLYTSGTSQYYEYKSVSSEKSKSKYVLLVQKPTDWSTNWKNYYCNYSTMVNSKATGTVKKKLGDISYYKNSNKAPKFQKYSFYTQLTEDICPNFDKFVKKYGTVYEKVSTIVTPRWSDYAKINSELPESEQGYFSMYVDNIPTWSRKTYYKKVENVEQELEFTPNLYYRKVVDRYSDLVKSGIDKLKQIWDSDKIDLSVKIEQNYDIGDIIAVFEPITNITIPQPITKKIVVIERGKEVVEYEVNKN